MMSFRQVVWIVICWAIWCYAAKLAVDTYLAERDRAAAVSQEEPPK